MKMFCRDSSSVEGLAQKQFANWVPSAFSHRRDAFRRGNTFPGTFLRIKPCAWWLSPTLGIIWVQNDTLGGGPVSVRQEAEKVTPGSTVGECRCWMKKLQVGKARTGKKASWLMRVRWRRPGGCREGPGSARWFVSMCEPRSTDSHKGQFCYRKFGVLGTGAHCHLKRMSASSKKGFERFKIKYAYVLFVVRERSGVGRGAWQGPPGAPGVWRCRDWVLPQSGEGSARVLLTGEEDGP